MTGEYPYRVALPDRITYFANIKAALDYINNLSAVDGQAELEYYNRSITRWQTGKELEDFNEGYNQRNSKPVKA